MSSNKFWTEAPRMQAHTLLWDYSNSLEKQHTTRVALDKACLRLVSPAPDLTARQLDRDGNLQSVGVLETFRNQGPNLSKEVVGGAMAMSVRPWQVKLMPVGASQELRTFCHQASRLVDGVMATERWVEVWQRVYEDALHMTLGAVKVSVDSESRVRLSRVDTLNLFWDLFEQDPMTLIEVHAVPRRRLIAMNPDHKRLIEELPSWYPDHVPGVDTASRLTSKPDTVKVIEATCVKVGNTPGRHSIIVKGATLEDDVFEDETHDICTVRWENDPRSWGGISLVRGCAPYHALVQRYQKMRTEQLKGCIPVIWKHIDEEAFRNISDLEYQIGLYSGQQPPKIDIAGTVSTDITEEIERLRQRCYQENGVSYEIASSTKPYTEANASASEQWLDTQSLRQIQRQYRIEQLWRDVATKIARKGSIAYQKKGARVRAPGTDFLSEVKWPKELKEDSYQAQASVASGLSLTVSGKLNQLERIAKLGIIDAEDVAGHLRLPDTESETELRASPSDLARHQIEQCLAGKPIMPSPTQDHAKAHKLAKLEYQLALKTALNLADSEDDEAKALRKTGQQALRRYIRRLEVYLSQAAPPPPPPPEAQPPAGGQPPPMQ